MIIADLHIHSRYSRATSRDLDPQHLWLGAQYKGIDLLGTGDFTHPEWFELLKENLIEDGKGAYKLNPDLAKALAPQVPEACRREVRFLLSAEISSIYKRHGKTRKVHSLILMPDFDSAEKLNKRLDKIGNIKSDGRPILGLDAHDLLELCLEVDPRVIFIPAHIWTPWFSVFGSKSGFDTLEEAFDDLLGHINALETGLSSDPPMNWRLSALDRFTLVSHSDAHSPAKLAREADILNCPPTYQDLALALEDRQGDAFYGTLEFFPHEGKYHLDGHRKCGLRLSPQETRDLGGRCPKCGGLLTVGVLSRVEDLADRPEGYRPPDARPFESIVPVAEVLSEVLQRGPATKGVQRALQSLLNDVGPELYILREAPLGLLKKKGGELLAEAVSRMRQGKVILQGGYDGEFGVVKLFNADERSQIKGQKGFWDLAPRKKASKKPDQKKTSSLLSPRINKKKTSPEQVLGIKLNPEQEKAVLHSDGHLIVRAGPGTGKTRLLVSRALRLVDQGLDPEKILLLTFTNKAALELTQRLAQGKKGPAPQAMTFHTLGLTILRDLSEAPTRLLDGEERLSLLKPLAKEADLRPGDLEGMISRAKQTLDPVLDDQAKALFEDYQKRLDLEKALDLDDLVLKSARFLTDGHQDAISHWQGRWDHILVDEYQDVNPVQTSLIRALCGSDTQVAAIGDPDQAIYGFRGADKDLFYRFREDFPGAVELGLVKNYRSTARILDLAQGLMQMEPDPDRVKLEPVCPQGPLPEFFTAYNPEAEAEWVARTIVNLVGGLDSRQVEAGAGQGGSYSAGDIAVLYRLHTQAKALAEALGRAGIPVQVAAREPLGETDPLDFKAQRVNLLSMHASKGLEFPVVFVTGLEKGLLPYLPPNRPPAEMDEERRLLFVALTRAQKELFLSRSLHRTLFGKTTEPDISPLLEKMPKNLVTQVEKIKKIKKYKQLGLF
jgi:DNA helicase-2/ATP-dependent DNA helicase PcrA